jgi:hypothetical protein
VFSAQQRDSFAEQRSKIFYILYDLLCVKQVRLMALLFHLDESPLQLPVDSAYGYWLAQKDELSYHLVNDMSKCTRIGGGSQELPPPITIAQPYKQFNLRQCMRGHQYSYRCFL